MDYEAWLTSEPEMMFDANGLESSQTKDALSTTLGTLVSGQSCVQKLPFAGHTAGALTMGIQQSLRVQVRISQCVI